ncbi:unnamed protein product [Diamesa hyperborea]
MNVVVVDWGVGANTINYISARNRINEVAPIVSLDLNPVEVVVEPFFNADNDVFFLLFTRRNPLVGQKIGFDAAAIRNTNWNTAAPGTRFIIHGFNNDNRSPVNTMITAAYLRRNDMNVVVVDWGRGANTINYISARNRIFETAPVVARFIDFLHENGLILSFNRVNIAGHSLGAHTAGLVGKRVTRGRIQVIHGLDPAGPLFDVNNPIARLAANDALYTEGIRTNAGLLGLDLPICQADFYPNFGSNQPGCGLDVAGTCAHGRANEFFAEAINSPRFVARRCFNYSQITNRSTCTGITAVMGNDAGSPGLEGIFTVTTNNNSPFAQG